MSHVQTILVRVFCFSMLLASYQAPARAQPGRGGSLPLEGKQLPTLKAFDEKGQIFSTASLKGSYTVLVFGCLT